MTDAELDDIRAAWRWAKPAHSVSRLLAHVDELRANRPITPEQIAAVKRVIEECVANGYDDFQDDPHTFGHLTAMRSVLATLQGMAAPGENERAMEVIRRAAALIEKRDSPSPQQPTQPSIEKFVAERAEKDRAVMVEDARRFDENLESGLNDFEKAVALMGPDNSPQQPTQEALALVMRIRVTAPNYQGGVVPRQSTSEMAFEIDRFAAQRVTAAPVSEDVRQVIAKAISPQRWANLNAGEESSVLAEAERLLDAALTAATDKARREALETAAQICEQRAAKHRRNKGVRCSLAFEIRALTPQNPGDAAPESEQ